MNVQGAQDVSIKEETVTAAAKSAFPVSVTGGLIFGIPISDIVQYATLIFLVLQIGLLTPKYWALFKKWRAKK